MDYLDKIILFLSCIFEIYIFHDFFHAYFEYKSTSRTFWKRMIMAFLAVISLFIINTYGNSYINLFGSIVIIWIYFVALFQVNIGARILYFLIAFLIGTGCEFLFGILLSIPAYMQKQKSVIHLSDIPWHFFTMKLLSYLLFAMIKQFFGNSKKAMKNEIFAYYLCIPASSLGIMFLTYYSGIGASVELPAKALLSANFAVMVFGNIFVFSAFNRYSEELYTNAQQKLIISTQAMELQYYGQIQKLDSRYREMAHNLSHYLKTIGELAKENKNSNIISILHDLNIELEACTLTLYCDNPVINSILSEKNDVEMDIYVEPGTVWQETSDADMVTMLGNLLDNALRAAKDSDNKWVTVRAYSENEGSFHIIKIENSYNGMLLSNASGFLSTKNEKGIHGIGIKSVENTAHKYDGYLECFAEGG